MYTVTKEFNIDYAHRLILPYESKCNNIHGHTGKIQISITGDKVLENDMVLDFNCMTPFIEKVKTIFDHTLILNQMDVDLIDFCKKNNLKYAYIDGNPTCEVFAEVIAKLAYQYFKNTLGLFTKYWEISCTFFETDTAAATCNIDKIAVENPSFEKSLDSIFMVDQNSVLNTKQPKVQKLFEEQIFPDPKAKCCDCGDKCQCKPKKKNKKSAAGKKEETSTTDESLFVKIIKIN